MKIPGLFLCITFFVFLSSDLQAQSKKIFVETTTFGKPSFYEDAKLISDYEIRDRLKALPSTGLLKYNKANQLRKRGVITSGIGLSVFAGTMLYRKVLDRNSFRKRLNNTELLIATAGVGSAILGLVQIHKAKTLYHKTIKDYNNSSTSSLKSTESYLVIIGQQSNGMGISLHF